MSFPSIPPKATPGPSPKIRVISIAPRYSGLVLNTTEDHNVVRARRIHQSAQFERFTQTRKYGIRHEVK